MVPTEDGGHIQAIYGDPVEVFSKEVQILVKHRSIDHAINLAPGYNLAYGWI